jgi:hypothetical protein
VVHRGGPFLRAPQIITLTFEGDDPEVVERLEAFGAMSVRSAWWGEASGGYCLGSDDCIGEGRVGPSIHFRRRLPAHVRDVDIEALLEEEARTGVLAGLGPESLVLVYLPPSVVLSDAYSSRYCDGGPRAFHRMLRAGAGSFPFAVIPRCGGEAETTATASHEILEAATNPDPSAPGFRLDSAAFSAAGSEPVDVCTLLNLDRHRTVESGFRLQRAWSNREAARGRDPCVPGVPGRPYAALMPRSAAVRLTSEGATSSLLLDAASDGSISSWNVTAIDLTREQEGGGRYVDARLDKEKVSVGDVVVLSLRAVRIHPRQTSIVGLLSHVDGYAHLWPVAVHMR